MNSISNQQKTVLSCVTFYDHICICKFMYCYKSNNQYMFIQICLINLYILILYIILHCIIIYMIFKNYLQMNI